MKLVIFGATGPTGRQVVQQAAAAAAAAAAGHDVTAVTRSPSSAPTEMPRVRFVRAGVADARQALAALDGADAVVSTYGVPYTRHRMSVYSEGMTNIIAAMVRQGVSRLVCVTSTSIAPGEAPGESFLWRKVFVPLLRRTVGRTLYDDMERMEALVVQSTLDWTIVRPGGLFNTDRPMTTAFPLSGCRGVGRHGLTSLPSSRKRRSRHTSGRLST
jgi:nucleoside-diphosphate-sugar epimerase